MKNMINININISIEDIVNLIVAYIPAKLYNIPSVYQTLTEYPNEVADMAEEFNISRNLMMAIVFDYDEQITKALSR